LVSLRYVLLLVPLMLMNLWVVMSVLVLMLPLPELQQ